MGKGWWPSTAHLRSQSQGHSRPTKSPGASHSPPDPSLHPTQQVGRGVCPPLTGEETEAQREEVDCGNVSQRRGGDWP